MLRPRDTPTGDCKAVNGLWAFALDESGVGREQGWWRGPLAGGHKVPVPASYNDIYPEAAARDHVGDAWYQRRVSRSRTSRSSTRKSTL